MYDGNALRPASSEREGRTGQDYSYFFFVVYGSCAGRDLEQNLALLLRRVSSGRPHSSITSLRVSSPH